MARHLHHAIAAAAFRGHRLRLHQINYDAALPQWLRRHTMMTFPTRRYSHQQVNGMIGGLVDYLEFGVYQGDSIRIKQRNK